MSALGDLISNIGGIGNAMGIVGDNPAGLNAMQRAGLSPQQSAALTQQTALASLSQNPDFQALDVPDKQAKIASITGDPKDVEGAISASALKGVDLNDPSLIPNMVKTGNAPGLDALLKLNPLLQTRQLQLIANGGQPQPTAAPSQAAAPANSSAVPAVLPPTSGQPTPPETVGDTPVNNPFNLRPVGASTGFRQFNGDDGLTRGMAAGTADLATKLSGTSKAMNGKPPTLRNIISTYSPPNENNTDALVQQASQRMGIDPDQPLGIEHLEPLTNAILKQENGGTKAGALPFQPQPSGQGYAGMAGKLPQPPAANNNAPQQEMNPITNQPYQAGEPRLSQNYMNLARKSSALTSVMGVNGDQARAAVQDKESEPSYVAWKSWNDAQQKAKANIQEKQGGDNIDYNKEIHDDAQNAIHLNDSLGEMANLRKDFTPGKVTPAQALIAQWKIALGMGSDADTKMAASAEGEEKLAIQNVTGQLKQLSSRPSQMEFIRYLDANPNIAMTPQGFDTILQYMKTQANLPLQKEQEFTEWRNKENPPVYRDFDTTWNKKLLDTQGGRMVSPQGTTQQTAEAQLPGKYVGTSGGKKIYQLPTLGADGKPQHVMEQ